MALRRPPKHKLDHEPLYVPAMDSAWKRDRILEELEAIEQAERYNHPVRRYFSGRTRFDLDTVREYLEPGYWSFKLRRLKTAERARLGDLFASGSQLQWMHECAMLGVLEVRGADDWKLARTESMLTEGACDELFGIPGGVGCDGIARPVLLYELGMAVWNLSGEMSYEEKKH